MVASRLAEDLQANCADAVLACDHFLHAVRMPAVTKGSPRPGGENQIEILPICSLLQADLRLPLTMLTQHSEEAFVAPGPAPRCWPSWSS